MVGWISTQSFYGLQFRRKMCVFLYKCGAFVKRVNHVLAFPKCYPKTDPTARIWRQGMVFPPRQCRSQWAFGTICCARYVEVHLRSSQGILESWPERWTSSWCLDPWYLWLFFMPHVHLTQSILTFCLVFSLSLCAYISQHMFLTQTDGSLVRFRSINRAFENAPYISIVISVRLFFWCFVRMIGHLFHLCIDTFGLPAALQYINFVDSQPLACHPVLELRIWPGDQAIKGTSHVKHI